MDGGGHRSLGLADLLTETNFVADGHKRRAGGADVLGHGDDDLRREWDLADGRLVLRSLAIVRMNAAETLEGRLLPGSFGFEYHEHHLCV